MLRSTSFTLVFGAALLTSPRASAAPVAELVEDAKALARAVVCPAPLEPGPAHCARLGPAMERFAKIRDLVVRPTLAPALPGERPRTAINVYGAGDLAWLLATLPDAEELVTLSPEPAGDPRRFAALLPAERERGLALVSRLAERVLASALPAPRRVVEGEVMPLSLALFLVALDVHGYEAVSLRFFHVDDDGSLRYVDEDAVRASDARIQGAKGRAAKAREVRRATTELFASSELWFRRRGAPEGERPRVHRHLATALDDVTLARHPGVARWLESRGTFAVLAKGTGFELWRASHAKVRALLLQSAGLMLSDASGPAPAEVERAGLVQQVFGRFAGLRAPVSAEIDHELASLFSSPTTKAQIFRFGHVDRGSHSHLVVSRPKADGALFAERDAAYADERVTSKGELLGGVHYRLWTKREGAVHVWVPPGHAPKTAGTVIYCHGYYVNVDEAWSEYALAEQFAAGGKDALYVVPEAATWDQDPPSWPKLADLLRTVERLTKRSARGPRVVVAHSGGFRSFLPWLSEPIAQIILVDGLYSKPVPKLRDWLGGRDRSLVLTSTETLDRARALARQVPGAVTLPAIPDDVAVIPEDARRARLLSLESQYGHMELVTERRVIPLLLGLAPLPDLVRSSSHGP